MDKNVVAHGKFNVNSRVVSTILGKEIIESYSIAIAEQIKNAKDAGSEMVVVDFSNIATDTIIIEDYGLGMSLAEILEDWFMVGTASKQDDNSLSGGKGIGRLSLFKLGKKILVETTSKDGAFSFVFSEEIILKDNLNDISIDIDKGNTLENHGTKITITNLDEDVDLKEVEMELENLQLEDSNFNVEIIYPLDFVETIFLKPNEIEDWVPFKAEIKINFNEISYNFSTTVGGKLLHVNDLIYPKIQKGLDLLFEKYKENANFGIINFKLYNFFFERKFKEYLPYEVHDRNISTYFLSAYQGLNIYRNGFKIYGHGADDWLKLAELRLKKTSENIDNKQSYGVIVLDGDKSGDLIEKSSREGFLKNKHSKAFNELILLIVKQFGLDRKNGVKSVKSHICELENAKKVEEESNTHNNSLDDNGSLANGENHYPSMNSDSEGAQKNNISESNSEQNTNKPQANHDENSSFNNIMGSNESSNITQNYQEEREANSKYKLTKINKLQSIDRNIFCKLPVGKPRDLIIEATSIDISRFPFATAFVFRAVLEVLMNDYIKNNISTIQNDFKDYHIDRNKKIVKRKNTPKGEIFKDVSNRNKILDFKKHLGGKKFDSRNLNHLNDLATFIDDLNLAMHWSEKRVSQDDLQTYWANSLFFIEFLLET